VAEIERDIVDPSEIETGTLYVGLENIQSGGDFIDVRRIDAGELASSKFAFSPRHLLYGKLRPYLAKIARPQFDGICSTDILPIMPGPQLDRDYLAHFLLTPAMVALANSRAAGANLPRLSPTALAELTLPLPPFAEQRRIAEILDKADALRAMRRAALAQLDTLTQAIFLDMFGDPAMNPKEWPMQVLGDLISSGPQNGLYQPSSDYGAGTPILRIDAFYDGKVTELASLKRVRLSESEQALYGLRAGEIVINRVNSREYLGKTAVIQELTEPTVFESNMMRFDVLRSTLNPRFLIEYLQTRFVRRHILQSAKDAINQASINQQDVKALPVFVPPMPLQKLFERRLEATAQTAAAQRASLAELDTLFASLQHRAFRGEL
jgi:type I restriction enzyme S subunit